MRDVLLLWLGNKYTIVVSLLTFGPFLIRGMTFRGEQAQSQPGPSVSASMSSSGPAMLPASTRKRFAAYPSLAAVGVLGVLTYVGATAVAVYYSLTTPIPSHLQHFTLPRYFVIWLLVLGLACLLGIGCALYAVVQSIRLHRWGWLLGNLGLLLGILLVLESGNNLIGDTFFSVLLYGPASAIIFGLFGPTEVKARS